MKMLTVRALLAIALLTAIVIAPVQPASAIPIVPTNLDFLAVGGQFGPAHVDTVLGFGGLDLGKLKDKVYYDGSWYTYVHWFTPSVANPNVSELNTGFNVLGFNGVAGYSFNDAVSAAVAFSVELDPDGTLDWEVSSGAGTWGVGETVALFFQSDRPPTIGPYNVIDGEVGRGYSYAPVPTLASFGLSLIGLGLLGTHQIFRRRGVKTG